MLPFCFWMKETIYFLQNALNYKETLKVLKYIHDFNGQNNIIDLKERLLLTIDPMLALKRLKHFSFKERNKNLWKNMKHVLDKNFWINFIFALILVSKSEGME